MIRLVRVLAPLIVLRGPCIGLTRGTFLPHVHVETLDADVLFSEAVSERRQMVEQDPPGRRTVCLDGRRHRTVVDGELQP